MDIDDGFGLLDALAQRFLGALAHKEAGRIDRAEDELRAILRVEPRLPEPRLELARLLLDSDRLDDAEDQAREALEALEAGGAWTEELPEETVRSIAHATLAEILRRRADEDDVLFGDPEAFRALVAEAREHFRKAAALDPSDETASYYAFHMGLELPDGSLPGAKPATDAAPEPDLDPDAEGADAPDEAPGEVGEA
jgi:tetratricopeptide (TPR) repeat protein